METPSDFTGPGLLSIDYAAHDLLRHLQPSRPPPGAGPASLTVGERVRFSMLCTTHAPAPGACASNDDDAGGSDPRAAG